MKRAALILVLLICACASTPEPVGRCNLQFSCAGVSSGAAWLVVQDETCAQRIVYCDLIGVFNGLRCQVWSLGDTGPVEIRMEPGRGPRSIETGTYGR